MVRSIRTRMAPSIASEATEVTRRPITPSVASSYKRPTTKQDRVAATELAATTSIAMFMRSEEEGPIFDHLNFKYEEVEGWPWAESPFIHIQQKVHKGGAKVLGSRFKVEECDYVLVPDTLLPASPEDTNKYFGPPDTLMEGKPPKYMPLAWLEDCLKQNVFIDPQAWLHLARLRPKGTSGTVPIIPSGSGPNPYPLPSNKYPLGGYKEWQTLPDRKKGAKVLDEMMNFEWKDKKKKDFFAYWSAQNGGHNIEPFCKKYNALFGKLCAPWGNVTRVVSEVTRIPLPATPIPQPDPQSLTSSSRHQSPVDAPLDVETSSPDLAYPTVTGARLLLGLTRPPTDPPTTATEKSVESSSVRRIETVNAIAGPSNYHTRKGTTNTNVDRSDGLSRSKSPSSNSPQGIGAGMETPRKKSTEEPSVPLTESERGVSLDRIPAELDTPDPAPIEDEGTAANIDFMSDETRKSSPAKSPIGSKAASPEFSAHNATNPSLAEDETVESQITENSFQESPVPDPPKRPIKRRASHLSDSDISPFKINIDQILLLQAQSDERINYALSVVEPGMPELWDDYKLLHDDSEVPVLPYEIAVILKEQLESTEQPRLVPSAQIQLVDAFSYLLRRHIVRRQSISKIAKRHKFNGAEAESSEVCESVAAKHPSMSCLGLDPPSWLITIPDWSNRINYICIVPPSYSPTESMLSSAIKEIQEEEYMSHPPMYQRRRLGTSSTAEDFPRDAAVECCVALEYMAAVAAHLNGAGPSGDSLDNALEEIWQQVKGAFRSCSDSTVLKRILALSITLPQDDFI